MRRFAAIVLLAATPLFGAAIAGGTSMYHHATHHAIVAMYHHATHHA